MEGTGDMAGPAEPTVFDTNWHEEIDDFEHMGLREDLLQGIWSLGFEKPSGIQQRAIRPITLGRDTIAQAQSGTGKTATFAIGSLQRLTITPGETRPQTQVLVLAPTRELADQSYRVMTLLGKYMGVVTHASIGGQSMRDEEDSFRRGCHVVVGTPGRVNDVIARGFLNPKTIKVFVIDEADEMLSRGFTEQIFAIFQYLDPEVQVVLISATMRPEILEMTTKFMRDPVRILVRDDELTLEGIRQYKVDVRSEEWKYDTLKDLYTVLQVQQSVIFVNRRSTAEDVAARLTGDGHTVACIHGQLDQADRDAIMKSFRAGESRVLISTNLLGRGIDVQSVTLVVNYDLPKEFDTYLHRIGRSGRFGRKGIAINFVTDDEMDYLHELERHFSTDIPDLPPNPETLI